MVAVQKRETPQDLRRIREFLERTIAETPSANGHGFLFTISPDIEWMYGKPKRDAFDSESGLVDYALAFANGAARSSDSIDLELVAASNPDYRNLVPAHIKASPEREVEFFKNVRENWRAELRSVLSQLISNRAAIAKSISPNIHSLKNIWAVPRCSPTSSGIGLHFHVLIPSADAFRTFVLLLMVDEARGFGAALCQCRLDGCDRFFLAGEPGPQGGRPQRRYCRPEHMMEAHARNSTERAQRSRARKSARKRK